MDRRALVLIAMAVHPVWMAGRLVDATLFSLPLGNLSFVLPVVEAAYMVDLFAVAAFLLWVPGGDPGAVEPARPRSVREHVSGFEATLVGIRRPAEDLVAAVQGLVSSTLGCVVLLGVAAWLRPAGYPVGPGGVPMVVFLGLSAVGHVVLQISALAAVGTGYVLLGRTGRNVALHGRVLTVDGNRLVLSGTTEIRTAPGRLVLQEGDDRLEIRAPAPELAWLADRAREIRAAGTASDVPGALHALQERTVAG